MAMANHSEDSSPVEWMLNSNPPSVNFLNTSSLAPRRSLSEFALRKAQEHAELEVKQLKRDLGPDDDDEEVRENISSHRQVLERVTSTARLTSQMRSQQETELHRTVSSLMDEMTAVKARAHAEQRKRAQLEEARHEQELRVIELKNSVASLEVQKNNAERKAERLEKVNAALKEEIEQLQRANIDQPFVPVRRGRGFKRALALVEEFETVVRKEIQTQYGLWMAATFGHSMTGKEKATCLEKLRIFCGPESQAKSHLEILLVTEGVRRNAILLEETRACSQLASAEIELVQRWENDRAASQLRNTAPSPKADMLRHSMQRGESLLSRSSPERSRSTSQEPFYPLLPWYPAGSGTWYHMRCKNCSTAPQLQQAPAPQHLEGEGTPKTPPRASPRTTPVRGLSPAVRRSGTPKGTKKVTGNTTNALASRTVENLQELMKELKKWRGEV